MWSLLDNLSALVILPVVALVAAGIYLSNSQSQVESLSREVSVSALYEVADWIERDLANVGSGLPPGSPAILAYEWQDDGPGSLTFVSGVASSIAASPDTLRYERRLTDEGLYALDRYRVGSGQEQLAARSPEAFQALDLRLVRADGTAVPPGGDLESAVAVAVRLAVPPAFTSGLPSEWAQTFPFRRSPDPSP